MKKLGLLSVLIVLTTMSFSQEKVNTKFGKGLYNVIAEDSSWSMKFALRFQSLYVGEWNVNDSSGMGPGSSEFLIRRARLKFGGFIHSP